MQVLLSACNNPDHNQCLLQPDWKTQDTWVDVSSLSHAVEVAMDYIKTYQLGSGNWSGGMVVDDNGFVGQISFNGSVWDSKDWHPNVMDITPKD